MRQGCQPFLKQHILFSSKLKEFEDDSFKFYEYGGNFFKREVNTVREEEIAC